MTLSLTSDWALEECRYSRTGALLEQRAHGATGGAKCVSTEAAIKVLMARVKQLKEQEGYIIATGD